MPCLSKRWAWHNIFMSEQPTPYEHDLAYAYSTRKLNRPSLTYWQFALKWLGILIIEIGIAVFIIWLSHRFSFTFKVNLYLFCCIVLLAIAILRWLVIDCVKLYQHYASEDVRHRCRMMPSCSEYTIISLRKYGLVIGLLLSFIRLYKRCDGTYRIEYPSLKHLKYVFVS